MDRQQATRTFYDLIWPHRAAVLRVAQILTANPAEADDLAQETLLKAFANLDRLREGSDVRAWLLTILRRTRIDRLRSAAAHPTVSLESAGWQAAPPAAPEPAAQCPEDLLERFSDREVIQALQSLPEEIRWTLLLVDVEGMSLQEAAEALDVPVGTIKSRAHRGRAMLREALLPLALDRRLVE